jgi:hypothetical protein
MFSFFLILTSWVIPIVNRSLQVTYFFPLFLSRIRVFILNYNYKKDINVFFIVVIVCLSQINLLFGLKSGNEHFKLQNYLTFTVLTPFAYLLSKAINERDIKIFIYFVTFECLFVFYESFYGISTVFSGLEGYSEFESVDDLIYFNRPYGLSNNASGVAEKLLVSIMFLSLLGRRIRYSFVYYTIFFATLIINFGRTAIVSVIFFYCIKFVVDFYSRPIRKNIYTILLIIGVFIFLITFIDYSFYTEILRQFTRGSDTLDLSGRDEIWPKFIDFISNNLLLGNNSRKLYFDHYGSQAQAHNSFIMALATHGLFIFVFYIFMLCFNLSKFNFKYVLTICLFSMTQYAMYWGISFMDIVYLFFLTSPVIRELELSKE